jgi:hypothetical protein
MYTRNAWMTVILLMFLGAASCDHGSPVGGLSSGERVEQVRQGQVADGTLQAATVVLQTRVRHGETKSDGTARFARPATSDIETAVSVLQQHARYIGADGSSTPATVSFEPGMTPADSNLVATPAAALPSDRWYWLIVNVDQSLSILDPDVTSQSNQWSTHFFTGSAPHIIRVEVPASDKPPSSVMLTFSEQVDLSSIDAGRMIAADGKGLSACVLRGAECWASNRAWLSTMADVSMGLSRLPTALTLRLTGRVVGSGRSVASARSFTRQIDPQGDGTVLPLTTRDLSPTPGGGSLFWVERFAPP